MFNLKGIDAEITNRCNAACPLCPRTGKDGKESDIVQEIQKSGYYDLPLELWDEILSSKYGFEIQKVSYCGNFGDPMMHPNALEIFETVHSYGVSKQMADTNGSMKTPKWWAEVGKIPGYEVTFSIDGLQDTNEIYRVKTKYENIIANAESFIQAGGHATWAFIVFKHNEHQVEEARELSKKMGFQNFIAKRSSRAFTYVGDKPVSYDMKLSKKKKVKADIELPTNSKYKPPAAVDGIKNFPVNCMAMRKREFYFTADMKVLPCCYVHAPVSRMEHLGQSTEPEFYNWLMDYNIKYDLSLYTFEEIVDSYRTNFKSLDKLWDTRMIPTCNKKCGSNLRNVWS